MEDVKTMFRQISVAVLITAAVAAQASTVYQNNFDAGSSSLSDFTPYTLYGATSIQASGGQLVIGETGLAYGGVSLNTASLAGYSTILSANVGTVTWAFNVANMDVQHRSRMQYSQPIRLGVLPRVSIGRLCTPWWRGCGE